MAEITLGNTHLSHTDTQILDVTLLYSHTKVSSQLGLSVAGLKSVRKVDGFGP
jgi:hypothetical protein